jgi:hypothetical protein
MGRDEFVLELPERGLLGFYFAVVREGGSRLEIRSSSCSPTRAALRHASVVTDNKDSRSAGLFPKPSDGLEPSTPSLPFKCGTGGLGRALADTFCLHIGSLRCVADARACPRVRYLMYPSRTRGASSVSQTDNTWQVCKPACRRR